MENMTIESRQITGDQWQEDQQEEQTVQETPDKAGYKERISALPAEDQAFLDGYLFAKVTSAGKKGA